MTRKSLASEFMAMSTILVRIEFPEAVIIYWSAREVVELKKNQTWQVFLSGLSSFPGWRKRQNLFLASLIKYVDQDLKLHLPEFLDNSAYLHNNSYTCNHAVPTIIMRF